MKGNEEFEQMARELQKKRDHAKAYRAENEKLALKVYDLLKSEGVTIAQSRDVLEAAVEMVNETENKAKLC